MTTTTPEEPVNRFLSGNYAPRSNELNDTAIELVEGKLPDDMVGGQYVRNGPNSSIDMTGKPYHWFDGDGMLHAVYFKADGPIYTNKYVRTPQYLAQKVMKMKIHFGIGDVLVTSRFKFLKVILGQKLITPFLKYDFASTANTAFVHFNRRFLALMEVALPFKIHLPSLDTIGVYEMEGQLTKYKHLMQFTAHPKVDHDTKETFWFGIADANEKLIVDHMPVLGARKIMAHDFGITKTHAIIIDSPMMLDPQRILKKGLPMLGFDKTLPIRFAIFPRNNKDPKNIQWFESELSGAIFHVSNAYNEGDDKIVLFCYVSKDLDMFLDTNPVISSEKYSDYHPFLYKFIFDLKSGKVESQIMIDGKLSAEFPVIDYKLIGKKNKYTWSSYQTKENTNMMCGIVKVDLDENTHKTFSFGDDTYGTEFSFVPAKNQVDEDDGYIVGFVHNQVLEGTKDVGKSYILIADAKEMTLLAKYLLPERVPYGFHGLWASADDITNQVQEDTRMDENPKYSGFSVSMVRFFSSLFFS